MISSDLFSDDEVEIHSNKFALITGCRKLKEYSATRIVLSFKKMSLEIEGEGLEPDSLINGEMAVTGTIKGVKFIVD